MKIKMCSKNAGNKPKKIPFSAEEDEQLIECVSSFEYIYNMQHAQYKSLHKKDVAWEEIANKLGRKRDECQARWKSIRDHYKRQRKEEKGGTGSAAKKKRASYWDRLSFLNKTEDERETFSNISNTSEIEIETFSNISNTSVNEFESPSIEPEPEPESSAQEITNNVCPTKRKRRMENSVLVKYLNEKRDQNTQFNNSIKELLKCDEQDDIDVFFRSIAMTVKKFKPQFVSRTKMKVLEIVTDMEQLQQTGVFDQSSYHTHTSSLASPATQSELSNHSSHRTSTLTPSPYQSDVILQSYELCQLGNNSNY